MRRKAGHPMMQLVPSTHPREGSPRLTAPPCRQKGSSKAWPDPRKPRGRTSRPGPPTSDQRQTRSACNEKQRHRPCRSSYGRKREGQTTGAIDTKDHESQSRGCSQTLLYNEIRPHSSLGYLTPTAFAAKLNQQRPLPQRAGALRDSGGFAPRPVATSSLKGQSKKRQTPDLSS